MTAREIACALVLAALGGCWAEGAVDAEAPHGSDAAGADLSARPRDGGDLAVPRDLRPAEDLAVPGDAFCAGTAVAGTCVAAFFEPAVACWRPSGGCTEQVEPSGIGDCYGSERKCWGNGYQRVLEHSCMWSSGIWRRPDGTNCLTYLILAPGVVWDVRREGDRLFLTWFMGTYTAECGGRRFPVDCPAILSLLDPSQSCAPGVCTCLRRGTLCGRNDDCCSRVCDFGQCR